MALSKREREKAEADGYERKTKGEDVTGWYPDTDVAKANKVGAERAANDMARADADRREEAAINAYRNNR